MYRSRHKEDLDKHVLNFLSSMEFDDKVLYYDILCTKAHLIMLHEIELLTSDELSDIERELNSILRHPEKLRKNGFEDIHEAIETHLISKLGTDVGGKVQTGRSRNDQIITDIRLMARDGLIIIIHHLIKLARILLEKSEHNLDSIMPLYTHLQQAQIGNFSQYLQSYSESLIRELDRSFSIYKRLNISPLGSGPIGGSLFPIDRRMTAKLLGFDNIVLNTIDATSSRDFMIEFLSSMVSIMITLSRIAEDLIIWSTEEFGFIEVHDKHASTSSAMPQKKNPDPLELIRSKTALVIGNFTSVMTITKSLPSGYNRDLQDTKIPFWNSVEIVSSTLQILSDIIRALKVNKKAMIRASNTSYAISLDIAEELVMKHRVPFRSAHKVVGALVKKTITNNDSIPFRSLTDLDVVVILKSLKVEVPPEQLIRIIKESNPHKSITSRRSEGSPNPHKQVKAMQKYRNILDKYFDEAHKKQSSIKKSLDSITETINLIKSKPKV